MYRIGVDIGGMSIKVGLVNNNGDIIQKNVKKTAPTYNETVINLVKQIKEVLASENISTKDILGVGIGCPGLILSKEGIILSSSNLCWQNVNIVEDLQKVLDVKVKLSNDANVAALAEAKYGKAKGVKDAIMFTLGTGVGGGIVVDGKLFEGGNSLGAEIGHFTIVKGGEKCGCGRCGCIEQYVSASALIRDTKIAMTKDKNSKMWDFVNGDINAVDGRTAFETSKLGDKTANEVIDNFIAYLGEGIMSMHNIFRPEVFIIGGGVSAQGDYLINKLVDYCEKYSFGLSGCPIPKILVASLGNDAGIIGAGELVA